MMMMMMMMMMKEKNMMTIDLVDGGLHLAKL